MLTSRERVELALQHREPDRVPLDLGGTTSTGIHVDALYLLRQALTLDPPGTPVKVIEPYLLLGEVAPDLQDALGVDVVSLSAPMTRFGFRNEGWKTWTTFAGTPVLVPGGFNTEPEPNGDILMYPQADKSVPACARMPRGGYYFDALDRSQPIDEESLNVEDNLAEFGPVSEQTLADLADQVDVLAADGRAVVGSFGGTSFGNIVHIPGLSLKHPKGIRGVEAWYASLVLRKAYVFEMFDRQCEVALRNLERIYRVVGDRVTVAMVTGTDFGAQNGPFISPALYRALFMPFHRRVNDWIHSHTHWKTFIHSCGSIWRLMDDMVEAGFDIFNPVQTSAAQMDPVALKAKYGERVTFWGGGIDTQRVLPFGTPDEIRAMVRERMGVFGRGGGFVFNPIHNVQAGVPVENLLALFDAVKAYGSASAADGVVG
jgi:hypothetical protein